MSTVLYCHDTPGLKLGPGTAAYHEESPRDSFIQFVDGFATIPKMTPEIAAWITAPGTPHIVVAEEGQVPAVTPDAFPCQICADNGLAKVFASQKALGGHLMSHRK